MGWLEEEQKRLGIEPVEKNSTWLERENKRLNNNFEERRTIRVSDNYEERWNKLRDSTPTPKTTMNLEEYAQIRTQNNKIKNNPTYDFNRLPSEQSIKPIIKQGPIQQNKPKLEGGELRNYTVGDRLYSAIVNSRNFLETNPLAVAKDSFVNTASLGVADYINPLSEAQKKAKEEHYIASTLGDIAGFVQPSVAFDRLALKMLPTLKKALTDSVMYKIKKDMVRGAVGQGAMGGVMGGFNEASRKD